MLACHVSCLLATCLPLASLPAVDELSCGELGVVDLSCGGLGVGDLSGHRFTTARA
jgi:hypothetical protein